MSYIKEVVDIFSRNYLKKKNRKLMPDPNVYNNKIMQRNLTEITTFPNYCPDKLASLSFIFFICNTILQTKKKKKKGANFLSIAYFFFLGV